MKHIFLFCLLGAFISGYSQSPLMIPPALEGPAFELHIQEGTMEFFPGYQTNTYGINQDYLGPVLFVDKGDVVSMNVHNDLDTISTLHWHGLHIPAAMDGGPHQEIPAGGTWDPSFGIMDKAGTYWFHPHTHMFTTEQVTMGAAGLIIVRDEEEAALELPRTYGVDDFPVILQTVEMFPDNQINPVGMELNTVIVNGVVGGYLDLPAQVVRLRLLNGSNHLSYAFGFSNGMSFHVIASDGGLLDEPVEKTQLILHAGERFEVLVDLAGREGEVIDVMSYGSTIPTGWPGSSGMMNMSMTPLDDLDFELFELHVQEATAEAITTIPSVLVENEVYSAIGVSTRSFILQGDGMMNTNLTINGDAFDMEVINEYVELWDTEIWSITNNSMIGHPFHVHGNSFYILEWDGGVPPVELRGRKDVVLIPPQMTNVKIILRYEDFADEEVPYMYHCHILDHEDMGMMGQYIVQDNAAVVTEGDAGFAVYPNPASGQLMVTAANRGAIAELIVLDSGGRQVVRHGRAANPMTMDVSGLSHGMYVVVVKWEDGSTSRTTLAIR